MSKNILLYVSGSISCYKACTLVSMLTKNGYNVKVIQSDDSLKFVGKASFEGLSHNKVHSDIFDDESTVPHIDLAQNFADLIIAYPASASCINRLSNGMCQDLFGAVCLANNYQKPLLLAPAMNTNMLMHPAVQESLEKLSSWGTRILDCNDGTLACGTSGAGRLIEPEEAFKIIESYFEGK